VIFVIVGVHALASCITCIFHLAWLAGLLQLCIDTPGWLDALDITAGCPLGADGKSRGCVIIRLLLLHVQMFDLTWLPLLLLYLHRSPPRSGGSSLAVQGRADRKQASPARRSASVLPLSP
jgi:hypothetical protein